ncbi:hypothetical protein TNCV_4479831 [Trichonephila clavipes]|nr:hypothetical protein TNCV_4479831 [Trichonephila clavipes]
MAGFLRLSLDVALSTMEVTIRFSSFPPQFRGEHPGVLGHPTRLGVVRGLLPLFHFPLLYEKTCSLTNIFHAPKALYNYNHTSLRFESNNPYRKTFSVTDHYAGWAAPKFLPVAFSILLSKM